MIFISYRKQDSQAVVDHLADRLKQRFGEMAVFKDDSDIHPGEKWPARLRDGLERCEIVLAVIGPAWLTAHDENYRRRIDDADDWVRKELSTALDLQKHVIVALIGGASMPTKEALPSDSNLVELADIQSIKLRLGSDNETDIRKLMAAVERSGTCSVTTASSVSNRYKIIAFDLDGTLIRGARPFSWKQIWDALGYSEQIRKFGAQRYLKGMSSHQEWCSWACDMFRKKGLTHDQLRTMGKSMKTVPNLRETLMALKQSGYVLALISGGIDVFLEEALPDASQIFNYIYINRLHFDDKGVISGVTANSFDFEGKIDALKEICSRVGCTLERAAFVGEGFNDMAVMRKAGASFAFAPVAEGVEDIATVLEDWDLAQLTKYLN